MPGVGTWLSDLLPCGLPVSSSACTDQHQHQHRPSECVRASTTGRVSTPWVGPTDRRTIVIKFGSRTEEIAQALTSLRADSTLQGCPQRTPRNTQQRTRALWKNMHSAESSASGIWRARRTTNRSTREFPLRSHQRGRPVRCIHNCRITCNIVVHLFKQVITALLRSLHKFQPALPSSTSRKFSCAFASQTASW